MANEILNPLDPSDEGDRLDRAKLDELPDNSITQSGVTTITHLHD